MKKTGKHLKEKSPKIDSKIMIILVVILIIVLIGIFIYIGIKNHYNNMEVAENEKNENQEIEESIETSSTDEKIEEEIEESIDTRVEQLIDQIRTENNLNENNFYFFYYNLEEKKYYFYNENAYFTAASTIKVPIAMLYYDKIAEGELTSSDTALYNADDYEAGGGTTAADYTVGERIPISYLLKQTIVNSDNTALNILMDNIGYRQCKEEITKYSDVELPEDFYTSNIANASYYYDVLQYLYQNAEKYNELIEYMKISSGGAYLKAKLPQYDVAHKYGSYNGYVHDYGIIYGENTYLIGAFTNNVSGASDLIANIGQQMVNCVETEVNIDEANTVIVEDDTSTTNIVE